MILRIEGLKTYYFPHDKVVKAVDGVSFHLKEKEVLGIVGESGCGKSTLAYSIIRLVPPPGKIVDGKIMFKDVDLTNLPPDKINEYRWKHISMVFQGAMNALDPLFTVRDQILEAMIYHEKDLDENEADERIFKLLNLVGLSEEVAYKYPFELSGGMKQRVVIAMALALNPEVVIADEPTTALDVTIQRQIMNLFKDLMKKLNTSFIIISHDISMVYEISNRMAIMYSGRIVELGDSEEVIDRPIHPYTKGLILSVKSLYTGEELFSMPGYPDPSKVGRGCRFADRCPYVKDICVNEDPKPMEVGGRYVECHFADELIDKSPYEIWVE